MTLRQQKWFISLTLVAVAFVPISFVIKWHVDNNPIGPTNQDLQEVNQMVQQIQAWNPGTQTLEEDAMIGKFLPQDIDDDLLEENVNEVIERRKLEKSENNNLKIDTNISTNKVTIHDLSSIAKDAAIHYKMGQKDNHVGQIGIDLVVKKGQFSRGLTIPIQGFHTNNNRAKNDVIFAKNLIYRKLNMNPDDDLIKIPPPKNDYNFERKITENSPLKEKLPSEIVGQLKNDLDFEKLAILELDPPRKSDQDYYTNHETHIADVSYRITNHSDQEGKIIVTAFISKDIYQDQLNIPIGGFKTKAVRDKEDIEAFVQTIKLKQTTTLNKFYPDWNLDEKVDSFKLGIEEMKLKGGKVTYKLVSIDKEKGIIAAKIIVTKGAESKEVEITIDGYRTMWQYQVDETLKLIGDQITTKIDEVAKWDVKQIVDVEKLGIKEVTAEGATITYKIINVNQDEGQVSVEVLIKNKGAEGSKVITVSGFRKIAEVHREMIERIKENLHDVNLIDNSKWTNMLPIEAQKQYKDILSEQQLAEFNVKKIDQDLVEGAKLTYVILKTDDENGQVTIEVTIELGGFKEKVLFKVKGFQTTKQHNEKLVNEAYKKVLDDNKMTEENKTVHLVPSSNYTSRLPSKVRIDIGMNLNPTQLRNLNIAPLQDPQVEIHSQVTNIDDEAGTITIVITLSKGEHQKDLTMIVKGFRTKNEQDKLDVSNLKSYLQDLYKDVQIKSDSNDKNALPSEVKAQLGTSNLTQDQIKRLNIKVLADKDLKDAIVNYIIDSFNDGSGQINIKVEIKQGKAIDSFNFQVKNFQTRNNRNEIEVHKKLEQFKKENENKKIDKTSNWTDQLPSTIFKENDFLSGERLNKLNLIWDEDDFDMEWEFRIKNVDDQNGVITVEIIIKKGFSDARGELIIGGFKSLSKN